MARRPSRKGKSGQRRVDFRPNRQQPARQKRWDVPDEHDVEAEDVALSESVRAKGDLSRKRTVMEGAGDARDGGRLVEGRAVAVRGQFVEVEADGRVWPCSIRRILRTLSIEDRSPVVVGDRVSFSIIADESGVLNEGVIEHVHPRTSVLQRSAGRRTQTIAANVDQVLIIASAREPMIKPHLIDRYLVAAHAGKLPAIICVNKADLDDAGDGEVVVERYVRIGYDAVATSATQGTGIDALRALMTGKVTLLAGQSGVGKSSLLNALEPGLDLRTGRVSVATEKGRHTTTTAVWLKLGFGAVIDTPGIRALDVAMVPLHELEMHFVEFVERLRHCKFPDCVHIHEEGCAVRLAVEAGEIDPSRYESYVELFVERGDGRK